jgi:RNA polymerase I-specific transcription initiation factor RRN3
MTASSDSAATFVSLDGALGNVYHVEYQNDNESKTIGLNVGLDLIPEKEDMNTDLRYILPKCVVPDGMEPVEMFVSKAVAEQNAQSKNSLPVPSYRGLLEAFRNPDDTELLRKVMIALRTSGATLHMLTSESNQHARLIHAIMRFVSFPPTSVAITVDEQLSENDENDYNLADAQLHLIMALVSANSVFLIPALTLIWKMLTSQVCNAHEAR